jgi:hypothetical protein
MGMAAGLAVLSSDFNMSTTISLIDPETRALVRDDCLSSGSVTPTLSLALTGDVTLPTRPQPRNELAVIDRGNAAIIWLDPVTCAVKRQLSVSTGFKSNPHDLVAVNAEKAYVTRYATNPAPGASANDAGDDLLIIDPSGAKIVGRIDLGPYAAPVEGKEILAQPDRAILAEGKLYVSLASQDPGFSAAGEGRLAVIDVATDQVTGTVSLPGMKGCSAMDYLASAKTLVVACGGSFSDADQTAASGIVLVDLAASPAAVKTTLRAADLGGQPVNFSFVVAPSQGVIWAGMLGQADFTTGMTIVRDALVQVDPSTGAVTKLFESDAFQLGRVAGSSNLLLVPEGSSTAPRVHAFGAGAAAANPTKLHDFDANPAGGLPPREIAWY